MYLEKGVTQPLKLLFLEEITSLMNCIYLFLFEAKT